MANSASGLGRPRSALHTKEAVIGLLLQVTALLSIAVTIGIVIVLFSQAWEFFGHVSIVEFLFGTRWAPLLEPRSFGVLPLVCGTLLVTFGAMLIAIPFGVGAAIYLSEYASAGFRAYIKPVLEILAGIPTVVYGYFALVFVTPKLLQPLIPGTQVFNAASASLVIGIMILPMVASICDDAFRAVPAAMRLGAYAVGATKQEVSLRVVFPAALSGVLASFVLAVSRAIGETMAVALAAGMLPQITADPRQSIQTMTSYIVQVALGDAPAGTVNYQTIFAVGALLFFITFGLNIVAHLVMRRYREVYE